MNDNDLITRREAELVLLEKGQRSRRYKLGEIWELNFDEIREALSEYQSEIVRCKNCKYGKPLCQPWTDVMCIQNRATHNPDWFCADGKRKQAEKTVNPG